MNKLLRITPILMLISCANVQSTTVEQNGIKIHTLTCSEFNSSLEECRSKASELCGHNYETLTHNKEEFADSGDGFYMHPRHHISVKCKA